VSIGYYLKIVYVLYMREPLDVERPPALAPADRLALGLCAAGILALGIFPAGLWDLARRAAASLPFGR
jgi:NADH:ubiquinone oxidoreductase subunit 2 (subunit N)